jgi:hypothetical protein
VVDDSVSGTYFRIQRLRFWNRKSTKTFDLPYLPPSEVLDCFTNDLMAIKPKYKVFSYIFENYILLDSHFPPVIWVECSSSLSLTTNGCEAFQSIFNKEFNITHPKIFKVIDLTNHYTM